MIDFHTHIVPPPIKEERELYLGRDPYFRMLYSGNARLATAEDLVASMDESGVDVSVALNLPWHDLRLLRETNDYILEAMARYPARIVGFGVLPPGQGALRELERLVQGGVRGLGELSTGPGLGLEDLKDLAHLLKRHGLPLLFHTSEPVGHDYPGKGTITPGVIYPFIAAFPDLTFVLAHWGGGLPFYSLMPEVAEALKNTHVDTAATRLLYRPAIYPAVGQLLGWDKVLFGTDFPLLSQARCLKEIEALRLGKEKKRAILGGNARRLLNL
jgi:predicted TIM-barrel fold metal-dependent hydrolase